jgi:hypothetical protein
LSIWKFGFDKESTNIVSKGSSSIHKHSAPTNLSRERKQLREIKKSVWILRNLVFVAKHIIHPEKTFTKLNLMAAAPLCE